MIISFSRLLLIGITVWTQSASNMTVVWDQIVFYDSGVDDGRIDVNTQGKTYWRAYYDYDGTEITSGLIATLNLSKPLVWNGSYWIYQEAAATAQFVGYQVESASESVHDLTMWVQTASDTTIIWDRIEFYMSGVDDGRIDVNTQGTTYWLARYDYDDIEIDSGLTSTLNASKSLTWNGTYWVFQETLPTVQLVGYQIESASEVTFGLTAWVQTASNTTVIWDQIVFYESGVDDDRIDVNAQGRTYWRAQYDYDDTEINTGLVANLNVSKPLTWNGTHWVFQETVAIVEFVGYQIGSASEGTYGLTAWVQTAPNTRIIWDRIVFYESGVDDDRIDVNTQGRTYWKAQYDFDDNEVTSGLTATLNISKPLLYNGTYWIYQEIIKLLSSSDIRLNPHLRTVMA